MSQESNSSCYEMDEFLANADPMDIVHIFWKFKALIQDNKVIRARINQESDGKIPILDQEVLVIAKELQRISIEDNSDLKRLDEIRKKERNAKLEQEIIN